MTILLLTKGNDTLEGTALQGIDSFVFSISLYRKLLLLIALRVSLFLEGPKKSCGIKHRGDSGIKAVKLRMGQKSSYWS